MKNRNLLKLFFKQLINLSKRFSRQNLYKFLREEIIKLGKNKNDSYLKILNIGAGGEISKYITKIRNANIISLDIDNSRNPDIVGDACDMKMFEDNSFDAVFLMEVLEHIQIPQKALDEIYRVLKTDGKLILSTPFILPIHDEPCDYYRYTKYGLLFLLNKFQEIIIIRKNSYINSIVVLIARMLMTKSKQDKLIGIVLFLLTILIYPFIYLISKVVSSDQATTGYFVTAIKK